MQVRRPGAINAMLLVAVLTTGESGAALDASRIVGPEKCAQCHKAEYKVWQTTTHSTMYTILHKKEVARSIADAMGVRTIKTDSVCIACHFTPVPLSGKTTATAGVSCESCHGPARDWIHIHNDLGGFTPETEPAEHKKNRLAAAVKAGMLPPTGETLFELLGNCYGCHTVPNEDLVNTAGHSTGGSFDVLQRVDSIRHNFLDAKGLTNAELSASDKRRIYLLGAIHELRASLRNATMATKDGRFSKESARRVKAALDDIKAIQDVLPLPELQEMILAAKGLALRPGNASELQHAYNKISTAGKNVVVSYDGRRLAGLQSLLDGPKPAEADEAPAAESAAAEPAGAERPGTTAAPSAEARGIVKAIRNLTTGKSQPAAVAVAPLKRHVRPLSPYRTVGAASCSFSCHKAPNSWWEKDKHYASADRLLNDDPKAVKIARLYGLTEREMKNGQNICMDCHGTIVTGKESREASDGVSCERCHGPAGDWIKVHNQNDKFNPAAFSLGMTQLADLNRRARVCTGCHYINEQRLISSGHTANTKFDYVQALGRIRHWQEPLPPADAWKTSVASAIAAAGPVPIAVSLAVPDEKPVAVRRASDVDQAIAPVSRERSPDLQPVERTGEAVAPVQASREAGSPAEEGTGQAGLAVVHERLTLIPAADTVPPNASITDLLRIAKQRLEILYGKSGTPHD